jgi:beta-glucosidase
MSLPDAFLWGAATSSHQVEGGNDNDWTAWEAEEGHIVDGHRSGDAAGWWAGRAEEDLRRAADLGMNAHRMSLEWSRIEPEAGIFDRAAFDRYRAILEAGRAAGLTMMVTLHHFTLPRWVSRLGGLTSAQLPELFEGYAARVARELGDAIDLLATFNEPSVVALMGYAGDRWPPGRGRLDAAFGALDRVLSGHGRAYRAVKRERPSLPTGIVLNLPTFEPASRGWLDRAVAAAQDWAFNGAVLHALSTGTLLPPLPIRRERGLPRSLDWVGLNYYGRYAVRFALRAPDRLFGDHVQEGSIRTEDNDWGAPHPEGMIAQLRRLEGALGVPTYVTENGIFDPTDTRRPRFLVEHVRALERAVETGVDVRGYFHWSLVDNFEWAEGWTTPFGLFALDRATQERTPRASAKVYGRICRAKGAPAGILDD